MIIRIVRMTFKEKEVSTFLKNFNTNKESIRNFEGCHHLELWQDINKINVFWTYSKWTSEEHLNNYRKSELFKSVWAKTKVHFKKKPKAWTMNSIFKSSLIQ